MSYTSCWGDAARTALLLKFLGQSYGESSVDSPDSSSIHLADFVDQYLGADHRIWWANCQGEADPVGCLWLGYSTDPVGGDRHPYIFLLYVVPEYRRRGVGTALVTRAESWAKRQGYHKLSLHVFCSSTAGCELYRQMNYQPRSILMEKTL
ncbi:MAG: GNAT family N-acetyltransferase [Elainellaceae cyanobacterium]